jgi:uncharacterized membrane-anchored protein
VPSPRGPDVEVGDATFLAREPPPLLREAARRTGAELHLPAATMTSTSVREPGVPDGGPAADRAASLLTRPGAVRVPMVITAWFWIIKVLTTAQGEATSDFFVHAVNPYLAVIGGLVVFLAVMALQLWVRRYVAVVYWLAVTMVAVFGTMVADAIHIQLGIPYPVTSAGFAVITVIVFVLWYRTERTLSIHSITTLRRELFYWAAVLATFALGTAWGDLMEFSVGFGGLSAGFFFLGMIAVPAVLHWVPRINSIVVFWWGYVLTRPLGASFADWMGFPTSSHDLGWGHGTVSLFFTAFILVGVLYLAVSRIDIAPEGEGDLSTLQELA